LFSSLNSLDEELRRRGSRLLVRKGKPLQVLTELVREINVSAIYAEEDYSPYARRRDAEISRHLPLRLTGGATIHHPLAVVRADGSPYTVFTPFSKAWKSLPAPSRSLISIPEVFVPPPEIDSEHLPVVSQPTGFPASEQEAQRRLQAFAENLIYTYQENRNRLDFDGTSRLSPYLRFGLISIRQLVNTSVKAIENAPDSVAQKSAETWLNELIWREFYMAILYHFPYVLRTAFNASMRNIPWQENQEDLRAWQEGHTGYPVVDAAMRQLKQTGWMHNRARMIVASFLTKDLLINWQEGERWFMRWLVDGDPAANNGGWQWAAGVGTDAAPYFRIFNPVLQGKKFDPEGAYVRRWVPELAHVPNDSIHEPWLMSADQQRAASCQIGVDYPAPIVNHRQARERVLSAYRR
ncbi:MAG: deoxyribodipyrimidine photo-lyase, partial [Anaerolineales bacterium]